MTIFKSLMVKVNNVMIFIAGLSLVLCMGLIVFNAIIRNFTNPISGTPELAGILGLFSIVFALAYTQEVGGNVSVNILTEKFNPFFQKITNLLMTVLSTIFFALVSIRLVNYGTELTDSQTFLQTTGLTIYPFIFIMSIGFIVLTIQLIYQILEIIVSFKGSETK